MINDKTAKMAINTLKAYCNFQDNLSTFAEKIRKDEQPVSLCPTCAVKDACEQLITPFGLLNYYNDVGTFEDLQKPLEKAPKFDIRQKDSAAFRKYINEIFLREAEKYGLPMSTANSIKWSENGEIKVTFVDDDNKMNYLGRAKCHPDDAFNPEIGIKLAVERAAQAMHTPFVPEDGDAYYYVDDEDLIYSTINHNSNKDALNIAVGNCFRKYKEAEANTAVIMKRIKKAAELLKKLQDERDE